MAEAQIVTIDEVRKRLRAIEELPALPTIIAEINEMLGNGTTPDRVDVGNLIAISGDALTRGCQATETAHCRLPAVPTSRSGLPFPLSSSSYCVFLFCLKIPSRAP